ncbi:tRNA modification GTPase MnmE [Cucumis melo var. makuwa]|uniref:tRNA modification GTPase MnmE n=1 Tax=Cucumis melo var. makuwa TaxID=1194695 RepID=A0A5A7TXZ7_CUCMM|nr:tRNA modification GTPase MnmE [Cucumis melo var. makuwa]TYK18965.1 tRNA modification GTPase MnmE [Cucumis melo var. makuwa]
MNSLVKIDAIFFCGEVAKLFVDAGVICIASVIFPYRRDRDACRAILPDGYFIEHSVSFTACGFSTLAVFSKSDGWTEEDTILLNSILSKKIYRAPSPNMDAMSINLDSFNKQVFTCAATEQGIQNLEMAISELVGLNKTLASGRRWTVNQI